MNELLTFARPVRDQVIESLGWMLVHSLWEIGLVALIAGVIVRALARQSANVRYGVLVAAMSLATVLPLGTWVFQANIGLDRSKTGKAPDT